jgi:hypothetical protein
MLETGVMLERGRSDYGSVMAMALRPVRGIRTALA